MSHTHKLSPFTGDSSRARPVGDAARGESGGIGSIASGSEARRPYSNQRCGCECNEQTKGEQLGVAKCRKLFPFSLTSFDSSPINGGAFWYSTNFHIKPPCRGRWMRVKRADGGSCELITERPSAKVTKNSPIARAILQQNSYSTLTHMVGRIPISLLSTW